MKNSKDMNETPCENTRLSSLSKKDYGSLLGKDVLYYLPVKLFPAITGLLSIYILTRKLAPGEYGTYSVVITTALLLTQLAGAWLSSAVLYVYPDYVEDHKAAFQYQVLKIQAIAVIPTVVTVYAVLLLATHTQSLALAGSLMMVLQIFQGLMQTFLQSTRQVISQAISVAIQSATQLTVLYSLVFIAQGKELAAIVAVSSGYAAAITVLLIQGKVSGFNKNAHTKIDSRELFNKLFKYGMPMCIWFFATQFYTIGDRLLLKMFNVTDTLGQYASFRDLATGCAGFLTMPLLMASHPIIMAMWKEGRDRGEIEQLISRNMTILTLMFIPLLVMIDVCGKELITPILGLKYLLDTRIMLTVVGSIYLGCMAIYVQKGLEVTGNTLPMAKIALIVVFLSLTVNIIIVKIYGVMGSSMMVIVSNIIYIFIVKHFTSKTLTPRVPRSLIAIILIWVVVVEIICNKSGSYFSDKMILHNYLNFFVIVIASLGLFVWGGRSFLFNNKCQR
jgi:O-antigen/teichoic acid export membrane protein